MEPAYGLPKIVFMRGVWGTLSKGGALILLFGGTVGAVDNLKCHDRFSTVIVNTALDARAKNYVQPIRVTKPIIQDRYATGESLRAAGDLWIGLADAGKLPQVYPGYYGESLVDGPKSDIFGIVTGLANRLSDMAENERRLNNKHAMSDAIRAIALIDIVRFGSDESMFSSSAYIRRPLRLLKQGLGILTPEEKLRILKVQDPRLREQKTRQLAEVTRHLRVQYATRYGDELTTQDDPSYGNYEKRDGSLKK
jgi:hypothetical protein